MIKMIHTSTKYNVDVTFCELSTKKYHHNLSILIFKIKSKFKALLRLTMYQGNQNVQVTSYFRKNQLEMAPVWSV